MPANSMLGQRKLARTVSGVLLFRFDRATTYAAVVNVPGGGTGLELPDEPSDCDEYEWANPDNSCGPGNVITLELSAAAIAAGVTIQGAAMQALTSPGTCGKVVFFEASDSWQLELFVQGGATVAGEGGEIVWRGGAVPSPGIVGTGAQVKAAIAASPVPLTVYVDSSAAPCVFLAAQGAIDCEGTTTFAGYNAGLNNGSPADVMTVNDGAQLHRPRAFTDGLNVQFQCVTATGMTFDTTPAALSDVFSVLNRAEVNLLGGAANPVVLVPAAGELTLITDKDPTLNTGAAAPVFQLGAGALLNWIATEQVTLGGAVFAGAVGTTIAFSYDDTIPRPGFAGFGFAGTVNESRISLAAWAQPAAGNTASRPVPPNVQTGQLYFDTTIQAEIVWNGATWIIPGTVVFAIVDMVAAYGVDNTGAADAGAVLAAAYPTLQANGQIPWLPTGTYKITSAAPPPVGMPVWVQGGVTFTGGNAASVANVALVYGAAPGTPAYNPAWYALTDVYLDPAAGLDTNTGMVGSPIQTRAEMVRRYGSDSPKLPYAQNFTLHLLSPQPASDEGPFSPKISGGGYAALIGTLIVVNAAFVGGVVAPKAVGGPGTRLQVATMPAGSLAGQLVFNSTRGSWAVIDSMAGAVATMTQPILATTVNTIGLPNVADSQEDNGWATGNTLVAYDAPSCSLRWAPSGGDVTAGGAPCVSWVQNVSIADISGTGASFFAFRNDAFASVLSNCQLQSGLSLSATNGKNFASNYLVNCSGNGYLQILSGKPYLFGGVYRLGCTIIGGITNVGGDCVVHTQWIIADGVVSIESAYCDTTVTVYNAMVQLIQNPMWGSYNIIVLPNGTIDNSTYGTPWVTMLQTSGTLALGANATGSSYSPASNGWVSGIALTPANLDAYGSLLSPQQGGRFTLDTGSLTILNGPLQTFAKVQTTDATVTAIYTEPAEVASTTYDYVLTVMGSNPANGDLYRADFAYNYQRIGAAAPTVASTAPLPLNVRTTGAGNTWGAGGNLCVSWTVVGNAVRISVQGLAATTINWLVQVNRAQVPELP